MLIEKKFTGSLVLARDITEVKKAEKQAREKMIVEKESLTEQDLWDWVWKDSLFHGSPGG